jgi:ribose transport system ATP-binding protein
LRARAGEHLERVGLDVNPDEPVGKLGATSQTLVAIARALQDDAALKHGVLVLDEPTSALPEHDSADLLRNVRRLTSQGVAVLMITHRLDEVIGVADRVSVFRDGALVASEGTAGMTHERLIELIVGRPLRSLFPDPPEPRADKAVLEVEGLTVGPLRDISFNVRSGEIVGVAGLLGSGRTTLLHDLRRQGSDRRCHQDRRSIVRRSSSRDPEGCRLRARGSRARGDLRRHGGPRQHARRLDPRFRRATWYAAACRER